MKQIDTDKYSVQKEKRQVKLQMNHRMRKNTHKIKSKDIIIIHPLRNNKLSAIEKVREVGHGSVVDYKVNIRAMMVSFYCGTGASDIANYSAFFDIPGGKLWEKKSHHSPFMCSLIISRVNG